jgi:phenylalanyl-tRNA synthetase beta chain
MKVTLSWIKDYLDTTASLEEIVEKLNMLGLVVDGVEDHSKGLEEFTVAHVITAEKHADADRLNISVKWIRVKKFCRSFVVALMCTTI